VASGDGLDGGADVRTHLLVGVGVVHLRHFFRRFKTAGERPIYELHGGDPFVVWTIIGGTRGERTHFERGVARIAEGGLADGGHRLENRIPDRLTVADKIISQCDYLLQASYCSHPRSSWLRKTPVSAQITL